MNSLRIVADNAADKAASVTSTNQLPSLPASNLLLNRKALVWRSSTTTDTLTVTWPSAEIVSGVFLPGCNLTEGSTMRITASVGGVQTYDSGEFVPCPPKQFGSFDWGREELGANFYAYSGQMKYAYHWLPGPIEADSVQVFISDPTNPAGYLEAARLVIGNHWSPEVTADLGVQADIADRSTSSRAESGDYISQPGTRHRTLTFSLSALLPEEAAKLSGLIGRAGTTKPVFVSLYPEHEDSSLEQAYQIFGSQPKTSPTAINSFNAYRQQISLEEF